MTEGITYAGHVIPNGMWVLERFEGNARGDVVGAEPEMIWYTDSAGIGRRVHYQTRPFGLVTRNRGGRMLTCARQVHKGELGQAVPIPTVGYVRQPFKDGEKPTVTHAHQRRRGQHGWVMLGELAEAAGAGYDPNKWLQLVLDYWDFSLQRVGWPEELIVLKLAWGSKLDIQVRDTDERLMTRDEFWQLGDPSELWVTGGFAKTVLRLQALGYKLTPQHA